MPLTLPDKAEGESNIQSIFFQEYLEVLVAAMRGIDFVYNGCLVTAQGTPNMTVAVAIGMIVSNDVPKKVTAGNVTIGAADATNPRIDLVVANSVGTLIARAGTAAATPKPPNRTANDVVLAAIYVPANATTITAIRITDMRAMRDRDVLAVAVPVLSSFTSTSVTPAVVSALSIYTEPGVYTFKYTIAYLTAALTTGIRFDVNHTGTVGDFVWQQRWVDVSATASTAAPSGSNIGAAGAVMGAFSSRAKGTAGRGVTLSVDTINVPLLMVIEGIMNVTAGGDLQLLMGSEVAASTAQVNGGSALELTRVA